MLLIFDTGRVVFRMPDWLHHFLSGGRILLKRTLEAYVGHYFQSKLEQIMQEHRLVSLITLLRGLCAQVHLYKCISSSFSIYTAIPVSKNYKINILVMKNIKPELLPKQRDRMLLVSS